MRIGRCLTSRPPTDIPERCFHCRIAPRHDDARNHLPYGLSLITLVEAVETDDRQRPDDDLHDFAEEVRAGGSRGRLGREELTGHRAGEGPDAGDRRAFRDLNELIFPSRSRSS